SSISKVCCCISFTTETIR
ncbi:hypothetical protein CP082626L3_0304B, partial [Chlamydia psittaci 08-2626_L3]